MIVLATSGGVRPERRACLGAVPFAETG